MAKIRRRVLRPDSPVVQDSRLAARIAAKEEQLAKERAALKRWMSKLKRAFHATEKQQTRIARLERNLAALRRG